MSSKKTKKQKWKPIQTEVISIASGTCWADEVEKEQNGFGGFGFEAKPLNLPKAPRAACDTVIDQDSVPQEGPYLVHMSNLQFEIEEDDLTTYFKGLKIASIKLPRNDNGRNKGFGYVEFEERKELIVALGMENLIRGRRVRVELASGMQDSRNAFQRGSRMGMDFKSDEPGDWRSTNRSTFNEGFTRKREGNAFDKDNDGERDNGPWRGARQNVSDDVVRKPFSDRHYDDSSESGGRRPFGDRRNNEFDGSGRRTFGERRDDVDGGRKPFSDSRRGFGFKRDDDLPELAGNNTSLPQERPKLILKPKTVDPDAPKTETQSYVSSSSIFGGAKPVDTAAKEREIEEKLLIKNEPKPQLSAASSITSLNEVSDTAKSQDEVEAKPQPQARSVDTWRRKSPRRQNDDDDRLPRRVVSPDRNSKYEDAPPPRENPWTKHSINKESGGENVCNGTPTLPTEEDDKPKLNVYIPPNLRKKVVSEEQVVEKKTDEDISDKVDKDDVSARTNEVVPGEADDLMPDGSELIETRNVEGLDELRTDPDGQSSEPEVAKDQLTTEEDKNDSGFIECDKSKKKSKIAKKVVSDIEIKKKDPVVITKEQKKSTSNKFAALLDDGSNE